jgi:hypothetical protein
LFNSARYADAMTAPTPSGLNRLAPLPTPGWLSVAAMLADLAFETDAQGRFTAFGPGKVLGQPPAKLLGTELAALLAGAEGETREKELQEKELQAAMLRGIIAMICEQCLAWHGDLRLALPGSAGRRLFRLSLAPKLTGGGVPGVYGLLVDLQAATCVLPEDMPGRADPRLDAETGLWTAATFAEELGRRFDRLDVEEQPGTLLYLGFSGTPPRLRGPVAVRLATELKEIVRPTDLLGRIDETTLALWCDGMDHLTGGERAARFCAQFPALLPQRARLAVGVAPRWARSGEESDCVIGHAVLALRAAEEVAPTADGPIGTWHVWQCD